MVEKTRRAKKRTGRPALPVAQQRITISTYITRSEKRAIDTAARALDISTADLMRRVLLAWMREPVLEDE